MKAYDESYSKIIKEHKYNDTDKDRNKVLPRLDVCYIYQKQGVQGFKM